MAAARIGRIRLKSGGAEVRVLNRNLPNAKGSDNFAGALLSAARRAAEVADGPLGGPIVGYLQVVFYAEGGTLVSHRWGDESPFNRAILPAFVAEIVRRDVVTDREARRIFDEMFERG